MATLELVKCPYKGKCCMRDGEGRCVALSRVTFRDRKCHFRKVHPNAPNMYDVLRQQEEW